MGISSFSYFDLICHHFDFHRNVEKLLNEKQEMTQSIQKLEERLVGQKDINSRLLSEIEKMKEGKMKEAERIRDEKEREFRIKMGRCCHIMKI